MRQQERLVDFKKIHAQHKEFLEATLWKLTGDRDRFADALQDALLAMWKHLDKLRSDGTRSYLYRIALTAAGKTWRQRPQGTDDLADDLPAITDNPTGPVEESETLDQLRWAITQLPDRQARAVAMRYLESKEYSQVAGDMNCSEAAVRSHVSKGLEALRRKLGKLFAEEHRHE